MGFRHVYLGILLERMWRMLASKTEGALSDRSYPLK